MLSLHFEHLLTAFDGFGDADHLHKELHSQDPPVPGERCQSLVGFLQTEATWFQRSVLKESPIDVLPPLTNGVPQQTPGAGWLLGMRSGKQLNRCFH